MFLNGTVATANNDSVFNMDKLNSAIERLNAVQFVPSINIRESVHAVRFDQIKKHKKVRNQSEAYHRRIDKKWLKRYGKNSVPCAYTIDNSLMGGVRKTLIAHPDVIKELKRATNLVPNGQN
jgi:predicted lipoprotein